jgi:hypothetical protein
MGDKKSDIEYSEEETVARRDAVIKLMLNTPPKPHKEMKIGKRKAKPSPKASRPEKMGRGPKVHGGQGRQQKIDP